MPTESKPRAKKAPAVKDTPAAEVARKPRAKAAAATPASETKRKPRATPVANTIATEAPATKRPRAKKAPPAPAPVRTRIAFPRLARGLSAGLMDFSVELDRARAAIANHGAVAAALALLARKTMPRRAIGGGAFHRSAGARAHRVWAKRRACGRAKAA